VVAQARANAGKPLPVPEPTIDPAQDDPLGTKNLGRAQRSAMQAEPRVLARAAADATMKGEKFILYSQALSRYEVPPPSILPASARRLEAGRALDDSPAAQLLLLEDYWVRAWQNEKATRIRVERGNQNYTPADYWAARGQRLQAEFWLAEARATPGKPLPLKGGLQDPVGEVDDPLETKEMAQAKLNAIRADPGALALAWREADRNAWEVMGELARGGKYVNTEEQIEVSRRLLEAERAVDPSPAGHAAALERHGRRLRQIEEQVRERLRRQEHSYTPLDYWAARYHRLQAELWLTAVSPRKGKD
jgi:hypothetical protein